MHDWLFLNHYVMYYVSHSRVAGRRGIVLLLLRPAPAEVHVRNTFVSTRILAE